MSVRLRRACLCPIDIPARLASTVALVFILALAGLAAPRALAQPARPKLIVAIAVDQYSASLFADWRARYSGGLARLAGGVVYSSGYQTHAGTETCPGHSTLLTGKHPNKTGIIGNTFRDPDLGREVYCLHDPGVAMANAPQANPVGPARLMATTLGDWMKAADPASRVVAVAGKDRGAITMGGHHADGTFWLVGGAGLATYMAPGGDPGTALAPVAAFNAQIAEIWTKRPRWTYANAECRAEAAEWAIAGGTWASQLPPAGWGQSDDPKVIAANVMASPIADELTGRAAEMLVDQYRLGRGPATDLLAVSFSATDFVGHRYGTRGPEMCDAQHRLDAALGRLLAKLDRLKVPYLVVLSADHGGSDFTERLQDQGYPARRVDGRAIMERVNAALMAQFQLSQKPLSGTVEEVSLVGVAQSDRSRILEAALAALRAEPDVAGAFSQAELLATPIRRGAPPDEVSLQERFAMSAYPGRSPDIVAALQPLRTLSAASPGNFISGHGTAWDYDRRVPMLFWWPGAKPQSRFLPVETVDIGPTLAAAIGVPPPEDIDGRCLQLPPGSGVACPSP